MLGFFRKYQKIFFIFITTIITLSFTVFGTITRTPGGPKQASGPAFKTVQGTTIDRTNLSKMILFLGSDAEDKLAFGGQQGPNFLNDGVIRNDMLRTGLAQILASFYFSSLEPDLKLRSDRERSYTPYAHPYGQFLSAESVWDYFAPNVAETFKRVKGSAPSPENFSNRVALYLAEQTFTQNDLKRVLRHQEEQYNWIAADPYLLERDLSLFGYHTLEDWFGQGFLALASEFVINASLLAEENGYKVTKEEAWTDLQKNAEKSFQLNKHSPYLSVANSRDYLNQQLQVMGMDKSEAIDMWSKVLLFRRLFQEAGNATLVDTLAHQQFSEYANQATEIDVYSLSNKLQFNSFGKLQEFEAYLEGIATHRNSSDLTALPTRFRTADQLKRLYPELVQRHYKLAIQQTDKESLAARIPVKQLWNWQLEEDNWAKLAEKVPSLNSAKPASRDGRFAILNGLDKKRREQVNTIAQMAIVDAHPEWIEEALSGAPTLTLEIGISAGGKLPFTGIEDAAALAALLEKAPVGTDVSGPLSAYSQNDNNLYRISVIERGDVEEILTFDQASERQVLSSVLDKRLKSHYRKLSDEGVVLVADQAFDQARGKVAEDYFGPLVNQIKSTGPDTDGADADWAAIHRFHNHLQTQLADVKEKGDESGWIASTPSLDGQWNLTKETKLLSRQQEEADTHLSMSEGSWSEVQVGKGKAPHFFRVKEHINGPLPNTRKLEQAQAELGADAQRCLMQSVLEEINARQAMTIDYLSVDQ